MDLANNGMTLLDSLKEKVETWHQYWRKNNMRYHEFMRFVYATSLTDEDLAKLNTLKKPALEFNSLEALLSRLSGEFSKQEPSLSIRSADGVPVEMLTPEFIKTEEILEAHIRAILLPATNDSLGQKVYKSTTGGGFDAIKIFTEYVNEMSFEQKIVVERVFDPTLTYFDPMAMDSHKGDGRYCGELVPKTYEDFIVEFGEEAAKDMKFSRSDDLGGFNWSYENQKQKIALVADHFEKRSKKIKIVKLSNGHVVPLKQYQKLLELWELSGKIEQPPKILSERWTEIDSIWRYQFCDTKILSQTETDFKYLPIIFVDGNSVVMREDENGSIGQMTRPYVYHAKGMQKLKNFCGETIAAEIENMVMHKWVVCIEAIPDDYKEGYTNVQQTSVLVYNSFDDKTGEKLDPPREVMRTPTPPIVESTFATADQVMQASLGSYDGLPITNSQQVSGVAIQQGAMQCNAAASPYLQSYVDALNRLGQIMLDLIPKYYRTPRSIPVVGKDGKRSYQMVNNNKDPESIMLDYDPNSLQIVIEAGVNSAVQKQVALDEIIRMMQSSELFAQFINTQGLETILDNMDIRGIDHLKSQAAQFMQQMQQQQEQAAQQPDPIEVEAEALKEIETMKVEQKREEAAAKNAINAAEMALKQEEIDIEWAKLMAQVEKDEIDVEIAQNKADAEMGNAAIDLAIEVAKHNNQVKKESME